MLAEYAVRALIDNYFRECVASFASALERLFEDFVRLTARVNKINESQFELAWKPSINRSERQIGAFSICWLIQTGSSFRHLTDKWTTFRNSVIHKGFIPSFDEAVEYGQAIIDCAQPIIELMNSEKYTPHLIALIFERSKKRSAKYNGAAFHVSSGGMTSPLGYDPSRQRFDLLEHVSKRRDEPRMQQVAETVRAYAPEIEALIRKQSASKTD